MLPPMRDRIYLADLLLLFVAVIWGGGFVAQRLGMEHVRPLTYNAARFALGAAVLVPFIVAQRRRPGDVQSRHVRDPAQGAGSPQAGAVRLTRGGALAGIVLFMAATLQQFGIEETTAGKAGFITGLYVLFVPVLGLLVGERTRGATWVGAVIAAVGLYLLSVTNEFTIGRGDLLVLACAVGWAVHVLVIARLSPRTDPLRLACVQFAWTAVLSFLGALLTEHVTAAQLRAATGAILYGGVCSVGIAYTLQVVGQRYAPPAHAAILLSGEAVFAALGGWWLLEERLNERELSGCALMLAGILASQVGLRNRRQAAFQHSG